MSIFNDLKIQWEPRDIWIGVYWDVEQFAWQKKHYMFWICFVPCFPISFSIVTEGKK